MSTVLETLQSIRECPILGEMRDEELEKLSGFLDRVEIPKNTKLFEQDDQGDALYIIATGQVGVLRRVPRPKDAQRERLLAVIGRGECIGEMALADNGPRSATVQTLDDVSALCLSKDRFEEMRDANPKLAIRMSLGIFRLLSRRLRQINKSLEIVHYWMFA